MILSQFLAHATLSELFKNGGLYALLIACDIFMRYPSADAVIAHVVNNKLKVQ